MLSSLQKKRLEYQPKIPNLLKSLKHTCFKKVKNSREVPENIKPFFPHTFATSSYQLEKGVGNERKVRIGVVFSGGPAAGGHNVIAGICDAGAEVIGFLGGSSGIIENQFIHVQDISAYRNQGGFDLLGSGRTKIESESQLESSLQTVLFHKLDGLVIIGGDDSNTNAAILAEYFLKKGCKTCVVGVPKTIDGDLRSPDIEISFGFDSACKTYAELIGNIARDALSTKKYYHFIKLMGRSASHVALECALKTHPNLTLISEQKKTLTEIIEEIVSLIQRRHEVGKEYGVILIPEGLIEAIPEWNQKNLEKDSHGNLNVSKIPTEKLLIDLVEKELLKKKFKGKFQAQDHFFGYEGRSCFPSNFDANYCYALGLLSFLAVREALTGVICAMQNLKLSPQHWQMKAIPIVQLMRFETRSGQQKPVIEKTLVDIKAKYFVDFLCLKRAWEVEDQYQYPGPLQFEGDEEEVDSVSFSLN
jgi:pyrophosphate--fructose-6-phosphate 1-phosphotransferase